MRQVLLSLLILLTPPLQAKPLFSGFTAEYDVSRNGTSLGVNKRRLDIRERGRVLDYSATTIPEGLIALFVSDRFMEHSLVHVSPAGLQPIRYEYQRTGGKKEIAFQAKFDWQKKRIQLSNSDKPLDLLPNTQDLLSFQLALMQGLSRGQRTFNFQVLDHKRIQLQTLEYTKTEQMQSSLGKLEIVQLQHRSDTNHYRFTFWCARQLNYLPVKIRKTEQDGDVITLKLRRFNQQAFRLHDQTHTPEEGF